MITSYINPSDIKLRIESSDRDECFAELLELIVAKNPEVNRSEALNGLYLRESKMSTAVFPKIAVPHAVCKSSQKTAIAIGISKHGIEFENIESGTYNNRRVNVIFEVLFEETSTEGHLHVLRDILNLACNDDFVPRLLEATNTQEVFDIIAELEG